MMQLEDNILYQTPNLYLVRDKKLEIRLHAGTHSIVVGSPLDVESGQRAMGRMERYIEKVKKMYGVLG